jgi:hypothetical protein
MANEVFTSYTEVDVESVITKTASKVSWAALDKDDDSYVYDDKGAGHFSGDIEHLFEFEITSADSGGIVIHWNLANVIDDNRGMFVNNDYSLHFFTLLSSGTKYFQIDEYSGGSQVSDWWTGGSLATLYYAKAVRDEAVGTYGTLYLYIYSDSARTTLLDTLVVTLTSKEDLRYIYACNSYNNGTTAGHTGYTQNLDLQELVIGPPIGSLSLMGAGR